MCHAGSATAAAVFESVYARTSTVKLGQQSQNSTSLTLPSRTRTTMVCLSAIPPCSPIRLINLPFGKVSLLPSPNSTDYEYHIRMATSSRKPFLETSAVIVGYAMSRLDRAYLEARLSRVGRRRSLRPPSY